MRDLQYKNFNLHWSVQRRTVNLFYSCRLPVSNVSRTRGGTQCIHPSLHCCARFVAFSSERVKPEGSRQRKQESMDGGVITTPDETKQDDGIDPALIFRFFFRQTLRYMNVASIEASFCQHGPPELKEHSSNASCCRERKSSSAVMYVPRRYCCQILCVCRSTHAGLT